MYLRPRLPGTANTGAQPRIARSQRTVFFVKPVVMKIDANVSPPVIGTAVVDPADPRPVVRTPNLPHESRVGPKAGRVVLDLDVARPVARVVFILQ